jgi:hypothetical protein
MWKRYCIFVRKVQGNKVITGYVINRNVWFYDMECQMVVLLQKQNVVEQVHLTARNFPLEYLSLEQVFKCILCSDEIFESNRLQMKEVSCYL